MLKLLRIVRPVTQNDRCCVLSLHPHPIQGVVRRLCNAPIEQVDGTTWCVNHKRQRPLPIGRSVQKRTRHPMYALPGMARMLEYVPNVNVCAYLEHRMIQNNQWKCALQTATSQAAQYQYERMYVPNQDVGDSFAAVRFSGFTPEVNNDLVRLWRYTDSMFNLLQGIDTLLVQFIEGEHSRPLSLRERGREYRMPFLSTMLQFLDVWMWPIVMAYYNSDPMYISLDFRRHAGGGTPKMDSLLLRVREEFAGSREGVFRCVIGNWRVLDWFLDTILTNQKSWDGMMFHVALQPNLLGDSLTQRLPKLLQVISKSCKNQLSDWMPRTPVQISKGHVLKGFHAYITLPDSSPDSMIAWDRRSISRYQYQILCDRRFGNPFQETSDTESDEDSDMSD